jgi:aspartate/methionine/tyrosine aminotransferase
MGQGYYAFLNIWSWLRKKILNGGLIVDPVHGTQRSHIQTVAHLKNYLAQKKGIAMIHGSVFRQPDFIRFSYADILEYVRCALERLEEGLNELI